MFQQIADNFVIFLGAIVRYLAFKHGDEILGFEYLYGGSLIHFFKPNAGGEAIEVGFASSVCIEIALSLF